MEFKIYNVTYHVIVNNRYLLITIKYTKYYYGKASFDYTDINRFANNESV